MFASRPFLSSTLINKKITIAVIVVMTFMAIALQSVYAATTITFTLYNADTNQAIGTFTNGQTLNLSTLPTKNLNVRANPNTSVGSVRFGYDSSSNYKTDNTSPYTLANSIFDDYTAWTPTVGTHTLKATAYRNSNAGGSSLGSSTISFTVIDALPKPTVTLNANPTSVSPGTASILTWSVTDATTCDASGAWSGMKGLSGTESTDNLTANATYTLTCTGAGGSTAVSTTVTVGTPVTILRKVDFESVMNPYPGWDAVFNSGIANTVRSTVQHHTGSYSGAATIDTSTGGESDGTRNTMVTTTTNGQGILPDDAYYSSWYYFPQVVTPAEYWNIFQFKRKNAQQTDTLPMYSINVGRRGGTTGNMYLYLWRHVGNDNGYNTFGADKAADAPVGIDLPIGQWVHLETHYVFGKDHNGRVTSWLNGQQLWDFQNVTTEYNWGSPPNPRHWTVNSYSSKTTPDKQTIYIDDAAISTGLLGE